MVRHAPPRDPWQDAPVGELGEQLLPRWFVILVVVAVPVAVAALVAAFVVYDAAEVPVAERRPPPGDGLTHSVGELAVGTSAPVAHDPGCELVEGMRIAGEERDRTVLSAGLDALCHADLDEATAERVAAFAEDGGVVRFAVFEATGVDSAAEVDGERILVNARFSQTYPGWIAPLVAHDVTLRELGPARAEAALRARRVEHAACTALFSDTRPSRGCDDAAELLALDDPLAALRAAGYRP